MSEDVGLLAARLQVEGIEKFLADMNRAGSGFDQAASSGSRFGDIARKALTTAGVAANTTAAGITALGVAVFNTGKQYNQLQQNSRAALKVLFKDGQAANAQMDALDAFAKNSPFAKDVFIRAQQQMLGFGIESQKVIPYLDAVQNAVAGIGGSNQDITDVTETISKIASSATLSAQDLLELGNKGINAAALIAQATGKTEAEVRKSIFGKPLRGDAALEGLDAMMKGMQTRFEGSTKLIKEQMTGAVDRVKAATRDIGAAMAKPFVDPNGGGLLVGWTNQYADLLRSVEKQVPSVRDALLLQLTPALTAVSHGMQAATDGVKAFNLDRFLNQLKGLDRYRNVGGLVAGGLAAMGTHLPIISKLGLSINPVVGSLVGLVAASPKAREAFFGLVRAGLPLVDAFTHVAAAVAGGFSPAIDTAADVVVALTPAIEAVSRVIAGIPAPLLAAGAAYLLFRNNLTGANRGLFDFASAAKDVAGKALTPVTTGLAAYRAGMSATSSIAAGFSTVLGGVKGAVVGVGSAIKTAFMTNPIGLALAGVSAVMALWGAANADADAKVQKHAEAVTALQGTLDKVSGSATEATKAKIGQDLVDSGLAGKLDAAHVSLSAFTSAATGNQDALRQVNAQIDIYGSNVITAGHAANEFYDLQSKGGISLRDVAKAIENPRANLQGLQDRYVAAGGSADEFERSYRKVSEALKNSDYGAAVAGLEEQARTMEDAAEQARLYRQALADQAAASDPAALSNQRLNDSLAIVRDNSRSASERISALKDAMNELNGGATTSAEIERQFAAEVLSLAAAFEHGAAKAVDASGKINVYSQEGNQLAATLGDVQGKLYDAMRATYDQANATGQGAQAAQLARDKGAEYVTQLEEQMKAAGLTAEQIQSLKSQYGLLPETVSTLITDGGTVDQQTQKMWALAKQIEATPNEKIFTFDDNASIMAKKGDLEAMGAQIGRTPDGKHFQIDLSGVDNARAVVEELSRPVTKTVNVSLGVSEAFARLNLNANGGFYQGSVRQYANGGFAMGVPRTPMVVKGGANILWGEPETGWEAYISGKPGMEARNRKVLADAANRLGMMVLPAGTRRYANGSGTGSTVSLADTPITVVVDGMQLAGRIRQGVVAVVNEFADEQNRVARHGWQG